MYFAKDKTFLLINPQQEQLCLEKNKLIFYGDIGEI
jgi:hypothetical protein